MSEPEHVAPSAPPTPASAAPASEDDASLLRAIRTHKLACPHCTYDLRHATSLRCPECGKLVEAKAFRVGKAFPKSQFLVWNIVGSCVWLVFGPVGLIALRTKFNTPPEAIASLLGVAMVVGGVWLVWSLAYRPLRWLDRTPQVKVLMWLAVVVPGVGMIAAMLVASLVVLWNVLRVVL